jgi:hypothetical protein
VNGAKVTRQLADGTTIGLFETWWEGEPPPTNRIYRLGRFDEDRDDSPRDDRLTLAQRKLQRAEEEIASTRRALRRHGEPVVDDAIKRGVVELDQRENLLRMFEQSPQRAREHLETLDAEKLHAEYARVELAPMLGVRPEELL